MGKYFPDLPARTLGQMGDVKDNPVHLVAEEIYAKWPVGYLWGRSDGTSGEHPKGLALDFSGLAYVTPTRGGAMDRAKCQAIADYLWKHRKRLGVWYVIWDRRIISMTYEDQGWREYDGDNPHTDHVHVSFYSAPVYKPPAKPQPEPLPDLPSEESRMAGIPYRLVRVRKADGSLSPAIYGLTIAGAVHIKNRGHLDELADAGYVELDDQGEPKIKPITQERLDELLERE